MRESQEPPENYATDISIPGLTFLQSPLILHCLSQAIENDQFTEFKEAMKAMSNSGVPTEYTLDVCEMVTFDEHVYPMTLMAFAGYYGRNVMLEVLHSGGARKF